MTTESLTSSGQQFVLDDADWKLYEELLHRIGDRHVFITYDRGRLELMSPSFKHDKRARLMGLLISVLAEELEIPMQGGGSTTFRREDLDQGLEPDQCFYVKNVGRVINKDEIDLSIDPPPDLAIEIEISYRMIKRIPLYESLGVPELWRDDGTHVRMYQLGDDRRYTEISRSNSFPVITPPQIDRLLNSADSTDEMNWMRGVRKWVREELAS
jgi:Uma2 family endonuclease